MPIPIKPRGPRPLVTRAELVVSEEVGEALGHVATAHGESARSAAARQFAAEVEEGRASYGGMLGRAWKEANRTLTELERAEDMPITKRVAALQALGKLMPLLAKAEAAHTARIGDRKVEDMSDAQLERELRHSKRRRRKAAS